MIPYSTISSLAQGGLAELTLVELEGGRRAVLRRLHTSKVLHLNEHLTFRRGVKIRAAMGMHENIIGSLAHGYEGIRPYEIIEYLQGENLKSLFNARNAMLLANLERILRLAAHGVAHVHQLGYMHLDVKPENFLCSLHGIPRVKLTDFDLAREATCRGPRHQMGTPAYMAPEQFRDKISCPASDVFAFCVMAYHFFTNKMPFTGSTVKSTLKRQASESVEAPPPIESNPDMPKNWNAVIVRGLAKHPEQRFPDMGALIDRLN